MAAKYKEIANALRDEILEELYAPDSFLPTEQQLCEAYSASRQTVRNALKILTEQGLISRRQGSGSRVVDRTAQASAPQRTVAVITTYIDNYIFPNILRELEYVLFRNNCTMQLHATSNQVSNERRILLDLLEQRFDGILVEGTKTALPNPNLDLYRKLQAKGIPLVFFNAAYEALDNCVTVLDDNYGGGYKLVNYLAGKGYTRIAGIFKSDDMQGHQRYAGFADAMCDLGLSIEDTHIYWYSTENKPEPGPQSEHWAERALSTLKGCSAVICYNDEVASAIVQYLLRHKVEIPDELAVVSFDNSHYSDMSTCRISSLSHGQQNLGKLAAEALMECFAGRTPEPRVIPWTLAEKESS